MNNSFLFKLELDNFTELPKPLFQSELEYRSYLTQFLLSGLNALGYKKSLAVMEEESAKDFPRILNQEVMTALLNRNYDSILSAFTSIEQIQKLNQSKSDFLKFEILKLKYCNCKNP